LREQVARFLAREFVPSAERWSLQGFVDRAAWLKAGENGLLCASIPAAYGGGDGHWGHEAVIAQEVARAGLNGGFGIGNMVSSGIVAHYILAYGSEAQKQRWLPAMARGELIGAVAMSEPSAGSDLKAIKTAACKAGGHYLVNGAKTFVSNGQQADLVIVAAKTDPAAGRKGFSLLVLETRNAAGFQRGRARENRVACPGHVGTVFRRCPHPGRESAGTGRGVWLRAIDRTACLGAPQHRADLRGRNGARRRDHRRLCPGPQPVRRQAVRSAEHPIQAGRVQDARSRGPQLCRWRDGGAAGRHARARPGGHGQMVGLRQFGQGGR